MASGYRRRQQQARHNAGTWASQVVSPSPAHQAATTCQQCMSKAIQPVKGEFGVNYQCLECSARWYNSHCWSCSEGVVDSRDPSTPQCPACHWHKCAVCGSCNRSGCATNPYNQNNRARDIQRPVVALSLSSFEITEDDIPF